MLKNFYTEQEIQTLNKLYDQAKKFSPIVLPDVPEEAITTLKEIRTIEDKAEHNALKYYHTHLDELVDDIHDEVKTNIVILSLNPREYGKNFLIVPLLPYLELLKKNSPEFYKKAMEAIDDAFKHREELLKTQYAKRILKELRTPTVKANTQKAKSVMLEVTKAGTAMRDKERVPFFYDKEGGWITTGNTKSKNKPKKVETAITLSFEVLQEWENILPKNTKLTPFVLEILTHCMTLIDAGNEYTTTKILFRQLNGGRDKTPTRKFYDAFYQALSVLACTRIKIDASEEFGAGYNERKYYEGALLPNTIQGKEIITLNGSVIEDAIHFLGQSPLFEYAKAKGQISPIAPEMYAIPSVTRTEENIVLIGYLTRAYASMVNQHSKIKPIIRYDTLYNYLGVEDNGKQGIRTIKARIRATVKEILTAWIEGGFIKSFQELTEDNKPAKERVQAAKILLTLYTVKEFKAIHESENILHTT